MTTQIAASLEASVLERIAAAAREVQATSAALEKRFGGAPGAAIDARTREVRSGDAGAVQRARRVRPRHGPFAVSVACRRTRSNYR